MARKPWLEVEGGLYHIITRGVDRQAIFHDDADHRKFLSLIATQKEKLPFFLYAFCLMTNHIHLLIERRVDDIGRIMHRVLTGYGQYYNRRYRRVGHVLQGRHKAILCQSDPYLAELVRYIHLNPVRAKMVKTPEEYPYSSHRAYIDLEPLGIVDVDPLLRRFGPRRKLARRRFVEHVAAAVTLGHQPQFYETAGGILGTDEFVDEMIHRIGQFDIHAAAERRRAEGRRTPLRLDDLVSAVETVSGIGRQSFCSPAKNPRLVFAKETMIIAGRHLGASTTALSRILGISSASISRRHDAALTRIQLDDQLSTASIKVIEHYERSSNTES